MDKSIETLKGQFTEKNKYTSFTPPQVVSNMYEFLLIIW